MTKIMDILESMADEELAVELLREFNEKSAELKTLLLNNDSNLNHNIWKMECDLANRELKRVVEKIMEQD